MKSYRYLLSATALVLFLGCSDAPSTTPNDAASSQADAVELDSTSQDDAATLEEVKEQVGEAAEVTREFTSQEMQPHVDSLKNTSERA